MSGKSLDVVEQGQRGRRWVGVTVVAALIALPLVGLLYGRSATAPPPELAAPATAPRVPAPTTSAANAVFPRTHDDGDTRTIRVTFPDGTKAQVQYPARMYLAELGVRPYIGATLALEGEMAEFRSLSAPYRGQEEVSQGGSMIRDLTDDVTLWPGPAGVPSAGSVLLFRFGGWRLALQDEREGLTFEQRLAWARNLRGRVTRDGFLVLSARAPLRLARPGEIHGGVVAGPQLWIGHGTGPLIVLTPTPDCERRALTPLVVKRRPDASGGVCHGDIHLSVSGEKEYVREVLEEVRITPG